MAHRAPPEVALGCEVAGSTEQSPRNPAAQSLFQRSGGQSAGDPRIGAVIGGRYRVVSKLASGGMGVVYHAERVGLGRMVAVKFLHASYAEDPRPLAAFECEAEAIYQTWGFGDGDGFAVVLYVKE